MFFLKKLQLAGIVLIASWFPIVHHVWKLSVEDLPRPGPSLGERSCIPIQPATECEVSGTNLGVMASAMECAHAAANHEGCNSMFMFSSKYPVWGCRCCARGVTRNENWALYSTVSCGALTTREALEEEVLRPQKEIVRLGETTTHQPASKKRVSEVYTTAYQTASEEIVSEVYGALKEVVETLRKGHLRLKDPWFAVAGTLLGALRCQPPGMLRWDDDVDLAVKASSLEDVHNVLKLNPRLKWERHDQFLAYKYGLLNATSLSVDIFGLASLGNNGEWHHVTPSGTHIERNYEHEYLKDSEMTSTSPCGFWDLELRCPNGAESYLQRTYGSKALSHARIWSHAGNGVRNIDMEAEDINEHAAYFPAMNRDLMRKLHFDGLPRGR